jgi:peroxiredoxin
MQCRSHAAQLGRNQDEFRSAGYEILVILGDKMERARSYVSLMHLPFPVLSDPDRKIYHEYGLGKSLLVIQHTASLVVDRNGIIRYLHQATNPIEWLKETPRLLQFVQSTKEEGFASNTPQG